MNKKNISLIGNCQVAALCYYIRKLSDSNNAYWLCLEKDWHDWSTKYNLFGEQLKHNVYEYSSCVSKIKESHIVIYQPNYNCCEFIQKHIQKHTFQITLSPIFVNNLNYIKEKEEKYKTNIKASDIILKNFNKSLYIENDNHLTSFLTLELLRDICKLAKMSFFEDSVYESLVNCQYPKY